jgi:hypothetical protein
MYHLFLEYTLIGLLTQETPSGGLGVLIGGMRRDTKEVGIFQIYKCNFH